ncbi:DUF4173 domain-containing protein [Clostridium sp. MCC353]|uniref:DUF4153 domain-containing protein n=1 Tax=Clostridium sp. MCC353 TaxID=2592646 RepID=UPI001C02B873|nr:DUF4173 domain-containing protein [Clostridium sp. MCC353]
MDEREKRRRSRLAAVRGDFEFYGFFSILFGLVYTLFLYDNPYGITYPLFVVALYVFAVFVMKHKRVEIKRGSRFLIGAGVLISASSFFTGSGIIFTFNRWAIIMLSVVFVLHQIYDDSKWNIGKYMGAIITYLLSSCCCIGYAFSHLFYYFKNVKSRRMKTLGMVLLGVMVGVPMVIILAYLLSDADMVFKNMFQQFLENYLNPWSVCKIIFKMAVGTIGIYSLICGAAIRNMNEEVKDRRNAQPVAAISCMSIIAAMYLVFCGVQIIYLFLGRGTLPEGVTYSAYAREGFFQLLTVAVINLVMVLCCIKYFKRSRILNGILLVICLCTYIMIGSAVYRMLLYVGQYQLTFLRIFVLWFLAMLSVLMIGVTVIIYRNEFPLFKHCLVTITVFYLAFAWMRPDYVIATYNVAHMTEENRYETVRYLTGNLSADAAPVIAEIEGIDELKKEYFGRIHWQGRRMYFKAYNLSYAKALKY